MSARILAVLNHKGGAGKTTTCFNLACGNADQSLKILAIDLDPRAHLAVSMDLKDPTIRGMDNIFEDHAVAKKYIVQIRDQLDFHPAGYRLGEIERLAAKARYQTPLLKEAMQPLHPSYNFILIDCPPTSGLINFNALYAAGEIIIPVSSDYLALHGRSQLLRTLKSARKFMQKQLKLWTAITRYTSRRLLSAHLSDQLRDKLGKYSPRQLLATLVRENAPLAECPSFGQSIFDYSCHTNDAKDYAALADDNLYSREIE